MQNQKMSCPSNHGFVLSNIAVIVLIITMTASSILAASPSQPTRETTVVLTDGAGNSNPRWVLEDSGTGDRELAIQLPSLVIRESAAEGEVWHTLDFSGAAVRGQVGEPGLPVISRLVVVPRGMTLSAEIVSASQKTLTDLRILPVQDPALAEFSFSAAAYRKSSATETDEPVVRVGRPAIMAGTTVVPVIIEAVQYDPTLREVRIWSDLRLKLKTVTASEALSYSRSTDRALPQSFVAAMSSQVLGLDDAAKNSGISSSLGTYVAVHSGALDVSAGIAPLLQWRREQGYHVIVLDTSFSSSNTTSSIKSSLQAIYDDETIPPLEFITIFGDATDSYAIPSWNENVSGFGGDGDHYYTMLEGDDILADAHIGRVSFGSANEMDTVIAKIVNYEKNPPMADTSWYGRACLQGDPSSSGITTITTNQWIKGQLLSLGWSQVDTTWSGDFITPMLTQVNAGVSVYGYRGFLGTSGISNGHVSVLSNGGKLALAILPTCDSGSFANGTSRSEAWLRAPNGGAVAAIGTATIHTHTRYNNCYYLGTWDALLNRSDNRIGTAHTLGKLAVYSGYYLAEPEEAEIWSVWNNVMGDGATAIWTGVPQILEVDHPTQISEGAQAVFFQVRHEGQPVAGARVSLYSQGGVQSGYFQLSALSDENGQVVLGLPAQLSGSITITVTGDNLLPYLSGMTVGQVDVFCAATGQTVKGSLVPAASVNITPRLTNHGASAAFGVEAEVSVLSGPGTILDGSLVFGNIPAGAEVEATSALALTLDDGAEDNASVQLLVTATDGQEVWTSILTETVGAAAFQVSGIDLSDFGGSVDPGESGRFYLTLDNFGSLDASGVSAILETDSPWINIDDGSAGFGDIPTGGSGQNLVLPFQFTVASGCFGGHLASFQLSIICNGVQQSIATCAVAVGTASTDQPTGPDGYGYFAIDNTDLVSGVAPVYGWVGIDPDHGGQGTDLGLTDFGWEQDDTKTVNLPFNFGFYGEVFDSISICSNGWLAMGETPVHFYRNFPLPASHSAGALIAPFWDNLNQTGNKKVYTWYDETGHRFIIQWYGMLNHYSNLPQNFEVILLDPAHHATSTGDGMILFQYETVNNTDARDGYATVGIQNMDRTEGLNYTYWNQYAAGAAPLATGRAILFVPLGEIALPSASITPFAVNQTLVPDEQVTEYLHISNLGDDGSNLVFDLLVMDPLAMDSAKSSADGNEPEVETRSLTGSSVTSSISEYETGSTFDLPLLVECSSNDQEWLVRVELDLPDGVTVNSAVDFPTWNEAAFLSWNGESGDGVTTTWGTDISSGYMVSGETSNASVNLSIDSALTGDLIIPWSVFGDNYGSQPHQISGEIILTSTGPAIGVSAPQGGGLAVLGSALEVGFEAHNGPQLVTIAVQREPDGPWLDLVFDLPAASSPWTWTVIGEPGPYARIRVSDSNDAGVFGLSGIFSIIRNLDWVQPDVASGQVPAGQTLDVAVTLDATGLPFGLHEANLVIQSNGGPQVVVPFNLTVSDVSPAGNLPGVVTLLGNHPNPFNPSTRISFSLPSQQSVDLKVYSARGRLVRSLLHGSQPAGLHHAVWGGRDDRGQIVASGVYFYRLETGEGSFTGKMVLTK
jgi:Peptidase family C25/FlgD Ig-like domain